MTVTVIPVNEIPEISAGDDLGAILAQRLPPMEPGDVVVVTQKIVSKAEGRVVAGDAAAHVRSEARRIVARRGDLVIAETRHGFVCANAGVDASNVADGTVALLPENPDASAERLRRRLGFPVVITDTFGRPWRRGLVNVAIGCAGLPSLVDLRGTADHMGRQLEATVIAFADEIAATAGLVMAKDAMVPAAVLRGLGWSGSPAPASALVRPPEEDLFRASPLTGLSQRRTIRTFGEGQVPRDAVVAAVEAACSAPAPHHTRPWRFDALDSPAARARLCDAMADAWRRDLQSDGADPGTIDRLLARSRAILAVAPTLIVPSVTSEHEHSYPDPDRTAAEADMFLLSGGAAVQTLLLALHAQGYASAWVSSGLFCPDTVRQILGLDTRWKPLGTVAVGPMPAASPGPRLPIDMDAHLRFAD